MRESGMNEKTAKALAEELKKINEANYASSKQEAREEIQHKTSGIESRLENKISNLEQKMKTMEQRIISEIKSATLIIVFGLGTIIALVQKFL